MTDRLSEQEKRQKHSAVPDYSTASSELFSSPEELTCFALVDTSSTVEQRRASGRSFFLGPETFIWVPGVSPKPPTGEQHSSATAQRLFELHASHIHVFARRTPRDEWFDFGMGLLNGIRGSGPSVPEISVREINIRLAVKLPEPLWLLFGGHPGWWLFINRKECEASSPDSVLRAIRDAWGRPPVDLEISRYAGDTLFAIADESGRATVSYWTGQEDHVSRAAVPIAASDPTYIFPRSDNYDHEVPVEQVISREEALSIIEGFVMTGNPVGLTPQS
jgi:hypothetical protein